jgi:hypothetical protein
MAHVRVGGWVELTVGEWTGDSECVIFGYVVAISGARITILIADDLFSPEKTGLERDQFIEVDLEDLQLDPHTVAKGRRQLLAQDVRVDQIRKAGAGRKPVEKKA